MALFGRKNDENTIGNSTNDEMQRLIAEFNSLGGDEKIDTDADSQEFPVDLLDITDEIENNTLTDEESEDLENYLLGQDDTSKVEKNNFSSSSQIGDKKVEKLSTEELQAFNKPKNQFIKSENNKSNYNIIDESNNPTDFSNFSIGDSDSAHNTNTTGDLLLSSIFGGSDTSSEMKSNEDPNDNEVVEIAKLTESESKDNTESDSDIIEITKTDENKPEIILTSVEQKETINDYSINIDDNDKSETKQDEVEELNTEALDVEDAKDKVEELNTEEIDFFNKLKSINKLTDKTTSGDIINKKEIEKDKKQKKVVEELPEKTKIEKLPKKTSNKKDDDENLIIIEDEEFEGEVIMFTPLKQVKKATWEDVVRRKGHYAYHLVEANNGGYFIKRAKSPNPYVYVKRKDDAVKLAKMYAEREKADLKIHNEKGVIEKSYSFGRVKN